MGTRRSSTSRAVDVLRDRERGVPRYNDFREALHRPRVKSFSKLCKNPAWADEIRRVYQNKIDDVDLMVGLFAETPPRGFGFSDTAFRIFILMASRRLKSDRFFTTDFTPAVYSQAGLDWIAEQRLQERPPAALSGADADTPERRQLLQAVAAGASPLRRNSGGVDHDRSSSRLRERPRVPAVEGDVQPPNAPREQGRPIGPRREASATPRTKQPQPLTELEEALLIAATGATGITMPDRPFEMEDGEDILGSPEPLHGRTSRRQARTMPRRRTSSSSTTRARTS